MGRWSRRKQELREGAAVPEAPTHPVELQKNAPEQNLEQKPLDVSVDRSFVATNSVANAHLATQPSTVPVEQSVAEPTAQPALPSLADTERLTPQSDFTPFMARGVAPEVKNAAMKKLFADPHFNVMDMMDVYVDDYSKPTPIPDDVLRQLVSAQFLDLFDERKNREAAEAKAAAAIAANDTAQAALPAESVPAATGDDADKPRQDSVAQSLHDDPDLRLQPDDAAGPQSLGPGAG